MRKVMAAVLTVVLLFGMAACATKEPEQEKLYEQTETTWQEFAESSEEETQKTRELELGVVEGNSYRNEYVGLGADFGADWQVQGAEDLTDDIDSIREMFDGTQYDEMVDGEWPQQIMDLYAVDTQTGNAVNLVYTKADVDSGVLEALATEEMIVDSTLSMRDTLASTYEAAGIVVETMEKVTVEFEGEQHYAMYTTAVDNGIPYYVLQLINYQLGGTYGMTLTLASHYEDATNQMLQMFYTIE